MKNINEKKLAKKKKLAVATSILGAVGGLGVGYKLAEFGREMMYNLRVQEHQNEINAKFLDLIYVMEYEYMRPYGVSIPYNAETYLADMERNRLAFGRNFDWIYNMYERGYNMIAEPYKHMGNAQEMGNLMGLGAGLATFLVVSALPVGSYLLAKRKYNKLSKILASSKEEAPQEILDEDLFEDTSSNQLSR